MAKVISGIQQMGIGVPNVEEIWKWYRQNFGMDVKIFEEAAEAPLMIDYTGGKVQSRTATLAYNMLGGGGFEIWQFTSRKTEKPKFDVQLGDIGLYICKMKCKSADMAYDLIKTNGANLLTKVKQSPYGSKHFYVADPNDNVFEIIEDTSFFKKTKHPVGGVFGCVIGVSDIENSLRLYKDILGYDIVEYDGIDVFSEFNKLPGGASKVRRVVLSHSLDRKGPFSELMGPSQVELIQVLDREPQKIFENRYWGDWGFIHLCFDIRNMKELRKECEEAGFPFTVDSESTFNMGEAGGQFSYIEDPDGTLIEFVETHKITLVKKLGIKLDLSKRHPEKSLPRWILKALGMNRVKD